MLVGSACFDPQTIEEGGLVEDGFSQTHIPNSNCGPNFSMEGHSYHHLQAPSQLQQKDAMETEIQQQLSMEMEQCYNSFKAGNSTTGLKIDAHLMQEAAHDLNQLVLSHHRSNWEDLNLSYHQQQDHPQHMQQVEMQSIQHQHFTVPLPDAEAPYPPTPDLLNMLPLPRCSPSSLIPNSSLSFANTSTQKSSNLLSSLGLLGDLSAAHDGTGTPTSSVVYDPLLPLNLPPQPPFLRELIHSLPHGYSLGASRSGSLFSGVDDGETSGFFQDGDGKTYDHNGVFEFTADMNCMGRGRVGNKDTKHFTTEKQRRVHMNDKFNALRSLVPNPTKNDRASIVGDAIDYINELKRTVAELKILVEKNRCSRERLKRQRAENGAVHKTEDDLDQPYHGSTLRSSWLHRKSKNIEVDVRIIDDEVTVKLVQQKRINCLLLVSKVLDELQLDLHHVAGGLIGDYYSFLFNSKISEGSTVYAHAIANKLIDVVDKHSAAVQPTSSY